MTREERKQILDSLPLEERMRFLNRCSRKILLCPSGIAFMTFPFIVIGSLFLASKYIVISETYWIVAVIVTTIIVAVVSFWPTSRKKRIMEEMLKDVQQTNSAYAGSQR